MLEKPLFWFELRSLDDLPPEVIQRNPPSWYFLTDGWYGLYLQDEDVLRDPEWGALDYYAARFLEDALDLLPRTLEEVPTDLADAVAHRETWENFLTRAKNWRDEVEDDALLDLYEEALSWWYERRFDFGYLVDPPRLWLWCHGNTIHVWWTCWGRRGESFLPLSSYLQELGRFRGGLLAQMTQRVSTWPDATAREYLRSQQAKWEADWFELYARSSEHIPRNWEAVRNALNRLRELLGP